MESAVGVLDEFLKPSERREGQGSYDPDWFYLEYRRAKSVEHALLRERAIRRKTVERHAAEDLADQVTHLKSIIERLVGGIRAHAGRERSLPAELTGSFSDALGALGAAHAGHLEMETLLRHMMAEAAFRVCRAIAEHLADRKVKEQPPLPPAACEPLSQWRKLQLISADQHRKEIHAALRHRRLCVTVHSTVESDEKVNRHPEMFGQPLCQLKADLAAPVQNLRREPFIADYWPNILVAKPTILHESFQCFMGSDGRKVVVPLLEVLDHDSQQLGKALFFGREVFVAFV